MASTAEIDQLIDILHEEFAGLVAAAEVVLDELDALEGLRGNGTTDGDARRRAQEARRIALRERTRALALAERSRTIATANAARMDRARTLVHR